MRQGDGWKEINSGKDVVGEIQSLNNEVAELRKAAEVKRHEDFQDRMANRKAPPLAGLTRTQKRFILEPWMTVAGVAAGTAAVALFTHSILMWSGKTALLGVMWVVLCVIAWSVKGYFMSENVLVEGKIYAPAEKTRYYDGR